MRKPPALVRPATRTADPTAKLAELEDEASDLRRRAKELFLRAVEKGDAAGASQMLRACAAMVREELAILDARSKVPPTAPAPSRGRDLSRLSLDELRTYRDLLAKTQPLEVSDAAAQ